MQKSWYKSKTLWIAALMISMAGLEAYQNGATIPAIVMVVLGAVLAAVRTTTVAQLGK